MMKQTRMAIAIAAVASCLAGFAPVRGAPTSLMFQVEPRAEECMYQSIEAGSQVRADVTIVRGGKLDARLKIDAPGAGRVFEKLLFSNIDDVTGNMVDSLIKKGHSVSSEALETGQRSARPARLCFVALVRPLTPFCPVQLD